MASKEMTVTVRGSFYYGADDLIKNKTIAVGSTVKIVHNPDNAYDKYACEVRLSSGKIIGHLPSDLASSFYIIVESGNVQSSKVISINDSRIKIRVSYSVGDNPKSNLEPEAVSGDVLGKINRIKTKAGVYKIINTRNGRYYIGSSADISGRLRQHFKELSSGRHHNAPLQKDYDEHGLTCFDFKIIKACEDYLAWEGHYVREAHRKQPHLVYNLTPDGDKRMYTKSASSAHGCTSVVTNVICDKVIHTIEAKEEVAPTKNNISNNWRYLVVLLIVVFLYLALR